MDVDWTNRNEPVTAVNPANYISASNPRPSVTPPTDARISASADNIPIGNSITFSCWASNAKGYTIGIDKDGTRITTLDIGNSYTKKFTEAGTYTAYVTAWNDAGSIDSSRVTFYVYDTLAAKRKHAVASIYRNGHLYSLYDKAFPWSEARTVSGNLGGYLATITSSTENSFVTSLLSYGSYNDYWIGCSDSSSEGIWHWEWTSEPFSYTNWYSGEPNNDDGNGGDEDYGSYSKLTKKWNDLKRNKTNVGFILETDNFTPTATAAYNGNTYRLYDYYMTWDDAEKFCEDNGGHLVTVTSEGENSAVASLLSNGEFPGYWIGYRDNEQEGVWKWITGETSSYTNWYSGEPNNNNGNGGGEDYACYDKSIKKWNDLDSDISRGIGFICEIPDKDYGLHPFTVIQSGSSVSITNNTSSYQNATVIIAYYDNGKLQNAVTDFYKGVPFGKNETRTLSINTTYDYKVFVWDSISGMKPLAE